MKNKSLYISAYTLSLVLLTFGICFSQDKNVKTPLNAAFLASEYTVVAGECIDFTDMTTGGIPTYWHWSFPGSEIPSSSLQNPTGICYLVPGEYPVILEVQNDFYIDQEYVEGAITVLPVTDGPLANFSADFVVIQEGGFVNFANLSQNNPVSWNWTFQGGVPETYNQVNPPPVAYLEEGSYYVHLIVEDEFGQQSEIYRENYITVLPSANTFPKADFLANRTFLNPEQSTSFKDLSKGNPAKWTWYFPGGEPASSNLKDPPNIYYADQGVFDVMLVVENNIGRDTILKEGYIVVSEIDPCTTAPKSAFRASERLIKRGTTVYFEDLSINDPTMWNWYFEGGQPTYSPLSNPVSGVQYNQSGTFKVSLAVNNMCGSDNLVKHDYIFVFSGPIPKYCDTISNAFGETIVSMPLPGSWGHIGGHNGQRITTYADKFEQHSFTQIDGIMVPVHIAEYANQNAKVTFKVWDGNTVYPDSLLYEKDVLIRSLNASYYNYIKFDKPVQVDGAFFVGYRIKYNDVTGNGQSDDLFVVNLAKNRTYQGAPNTLYVERNNEWQTATERFNVKTSTDIRPIVCIVDVSEFKKDYEISVFPNPADSRFMINTGNIETNTNIEIIVADITGRLVYKQQFKAAKEQIEINSSEFNNGMYFVVLKFDNQVITKRLMIVR